jgi:small nuclear ribonucleoprotein (snRNP)-like protein
VHLKSSKDYTRPLLFDITGMIKKIDGLEVRQTGDITADDYTEKKTDATMAQSAPKSEEQPTISKSSNITAGEKVLRISNIIMKQFNKRFPRAEKVSWTKQGQEFIAKLTNYDQQVEAVFLENGMQVYTSYPFDKYNIPDPIAAHLKNDPAKYKFVSGKRVVYESKYRRSVVETAAGEKPQDFYEVIVSYRIPKSKKTEYYRFRFNQTGQFEFKMPYENNQ